MGVGYCKYLYHDADDPQPDESAYDKVYDLSWDECTTGYDNLPSTKAVRCLKEVFGLKPDPELLAYQLTVRPEVVAKMDAYLQRIGCKRLAETGKWNAVCAHHIGNTSSDRKSLSDELIGAFCKRVIGMGFVPIIFDWDRRSKLPDDKTIFCPGCGPGDLWGNIGTGDAERITAFIQRCSLMVGIDSGPQKCAGATDTPTIGVWTKHDPLRYYDLCDNVTHVFSEETDVYPLLRRPQHMAYFIRHYKHARYVPGQLLACLSEQADRLLPENRSFAEPKVYSFPEPQKANGKRFADIILNVPQGIGDIFWIYQKFAPHVDRIHWRVACVVPTTIQMRAVLSGFLELLPQTASVSLFKDTQEHYDELFSGWYSMDQVFSEPGILHDYACNKPLEEGVRLEDIDPQWSVLETVDLRSEEFPVPGDAVCLYVCGNTWDVGYKERYKLWSVEEWQRFVRLFYAKYSFSCPLVLLGAGYDRDVLEAIADGLRELKTELHVDRKPAQVVHLLKHARALIAYQSGLSVIADNLDTPTLNMTFPCYPSMLYSWCKPRNRQSKRFAADLFGRTPESVVSDLDIQVT